MLCIYTNIAAPGTLPSTTNPHHEQSRAVSSPRAAEHRCELPTGPEHGGDRRSPG